MDKDIADIEKGRKERKAVYATLDRVYKTNKEVENIFSEIIEYLNWAMSSRATNKTKKKAFRLLQEVKADTETDFRSQHGIYSSEVMSFLCQRGEPTKKPG